MLPGSRRNPLPACWCGLVLCLLVLPLHGQQPGPVSLEEKLREVQQLIQEGKVAAARTQLKQLEKNFPDVPAAHNLLGVVEAQGGNYRAAEAHFKKAVALVPQYEGALLNLGRLYQEHTNADPGAVDMATAVYERILIINPDSLEAKYQLAGLHSRKGQYRTSLEYLEQIPPSHRDRAQVLSLLCANYVRTGDHQQARQAAERLAVASDLTESEVSSILPRLVEHRALELATSLLEALERRGLASSEGLYQLGLIYEQQEKLLQARAVLLKASELQPNTVPILVALARVAEKQKDHTSALSFLAHARDLAPNDAAVHFFFGLVCMEMNLIIEAHQSLGRAVALEPDNPQYNYAMGVIAQQRTQHREAVKYFQKYCALKPADARGRLALGVAYFYSHEPEAARRELTVCLQQTETSAVAHYFLGRLASQEGKLAEAQQAIEQALKVIPDFADAYAELGNLYLKQREYARAEEALKKALDLEPDSYQANLYLTMLYLRTRDPRGPAQSRAFEELKKKKSERVKEFYRMIEVRPLG